MKIIPSGKVATSAVLLTLGKNANAFLTQLSQQRNFHPLSGQALPRNKLAKLSEHIRSCYVTQAKDQLHLKSNTLKSLNPKAQSMRLFYSDPENFSHPESLPDVNKTQGLTFPKKTKKDLFLKNYRLSPNNDVRHIIPLFLFKAALTKAHFCHGDNDELLNFYTKKLNQCGANTTNIEPHQAKRRFYTQIAKCRFNVFVGNAKENHLLGHYGYRLFEQSNSMTQNLHSISYPEEAIVPQKEILKLHDYTKHHLFTYLLLDRKKDAFSLSFARMIHNEFEQLALHQQNNPKLTWAQSRQALLKSIYRVRDAAMFDDPKGNHDGIRDTQKKHLIPAYYQLHSYLSSEKADLDTLLKAFELIYENEKACLKYFPNKKWQDLYPLANSSKNTDKCFAQTVGKTLLMPPKP